MSVKEDKVNLIITINGDKARKELSSLDNEARKLREEMKGLNKESEDYVNKSKRLNEVEARMKELRAEIGLSAKTLKELNQELRMLTSARQYLQPGTDAFRQNEAAIKAVRGRITELNAGIRDTGGVLNVIKNEIRQFGILAASYLGFQFLSQQITGIISKAGKLSDQLADVAKTTGMSSKEVEQLNKELSKIDTRTSTTELRNIAVVAGQLGIAKEDIRGFTESIDKATVALGDEFTGGAAEVAQTLGKLRNIFSDVKSDQVDKDLMQIGNALNQLGASGAATGPVVADFANRIGGVGITLGLTSSQVLGLSATLQELNVNTERGGTAVTRILQKMTTDTGAFAKVAGMDVKQFTTLVNTDLFGALQKVIEGVNSGGASATEFSKILDGLGVDGAGASEVMSKLAANMPLLTEKVNLAGDAIQRTDGITAEFAIKNENLGAKLDKLGKKFYALVTSDSVKNFLSGAVDKLSTFIDWLSKAPEWIDRNQRALRLMAEAFIAYNASMIAASASAVLNTAAEHAKAAAQKLSAMWTGITTTATKAYALSTDVLTGKITVATAVQRVWNAVLAMNPVGLILGGLVALIEAVDLYRSNTSEAIALEKQKIQVSKDIAKAQNDLNEANKVYTDQIQKLNQLGPEQRANLEKTIALKIKDAEASLIQLKAQQQQIGEASTQVGTWEAIFNGLKNINNPAAAAAENLTSAINNGREAAEKYNEPIKALENSLNELRGTSKELSDITHAYDNAMKINAQTSEQYNEKLRLLRVALGHAVVGSTEYKRIQEAIAKTQGEMAAKGGAEVIDQDALDEAVKKLKDLQEELKKIEFGLLQDSRGKFEADVAAINNKYDELLAKAKGHAAEEKKIQELRNQELANLEKNFKLETDAIRNQLYFSRLSKEEQEIEAIRQKYAERIADYAGFQDKIRELEALRDAEIADKTAQQDAKKLQDRIALEDQIWLLSQSSNEREVAEESMKWDSLILQAEQHGLDSTNLYQLKADAITAILKQQADKEVKDNDAKNKKLLAADRQRWETVHNNAQTFLSAISGLFAVFGAKQSTMLEFQKMAALTQITIDSAAAISGAIKTASTSSVSTIDLVLSIAAAVATVTKGIMSAKQVLSGATVPSVPGFKSGGKLPGGTVLPGTSVTDDNLLVVDPATGQSVARVKSGEPILSTETYDNNRELVDALLDSSMNKGGARIPGLNTGGIIDMPLTVPLNPNIPELTRSIRADKFGGGTQSIAADGTAISNGGNIKELLDSNNAMMAGMISEMMVTFKDSLKDMEITGRWDWDYYKRTKTRMEELESTSKLG